MFHLWVSRFLSFFFLTMLFIVAEVRNCWKKLPFLNSPLIGLSLRMDMGLWWKYKSLNKLDCQLQGHLNGCIILKCEKKRKPFFLVVNNLLHLRFPEEENGLGNKENILLYILLVRVIKKFNASSHCWFDVCESEMVFCLPFYEGKEGIILVDLLLLLGNI